LSLHKEKKEKIMKKKQRTKRKLKTHKAMSKRLHITASGKVLRRKVGISHLRRNKSPRSVRAADKLFQLKSADSTRLKRLLPYAF
jgi:large subunit ribosomal protein L35